MYEIHSFYAPKELLVIKRMPVLYTEFLKKIYNILFVENLVTKHIF